MEPEQPAAADEVEERVHAFLVHMVKASRHRLGPDTDLYGDLGIYGDDVDDVFLEFLERFDVPMEGLDVTGCFPGEGQAWGCLWPFPWFVQPFEPTRRVRVAHLVEAARTKVWPAFDELPGPGGA